MAGSERKRREAASGNNNPRIPALPRLLPKTTAPSLERPAFTDYDVARTVSAQSGYQPSGGYGATGGLHESPYQQSGGGCGAGGSSYGSRYQPSGGGNGAGGSSYRSGYQPYPPSQPSGYPNLLADESKLPVEDSSLRTKPSSPRRKASPRRLVHDLSEKDSEDDVPQSQPRLKRTELVVSQGGEVWTPDHIQTLRDVMALKRKRGDSHVFHRVSKKLDGVHSPSACRKKWTELEGAEELEKIAARLSGYYLGEATLELYDGFLASGWNRTDAIKLHVMKDLNSRIREERIEFNLEFRYSVASIREQLDILQNSDFIRLKPASRPWTGNDKNSFIPLKESGAIEEDLMYACIRTREDIREHWNEWGVEDNVVPTGGRDKRKADDRKKGDDKRKRGRRG